MAWKLWLRGLVAAFVSAGAGSGALVIADPKTFNLFDGGAKTLAEVALVLGLSSALAYLKEHPIPEEETTVNVQKLVALLLPVVFVASLASGCAGIKAPTTSPQVLSTLKATEVVHGLDTFRDVAKVVSDAYPGIVTPADFQKILTAHTSIVAVIGAAPNGWKATAEAALDQLQKDLSPAALSRLQPYLILARALVEEFVPAAPGLEPDLSLLLDQTQRIDHALLVR